MKVTELKIKIVMFAMEEKKFLLFFYCLNKNFACIIKNFNKNWPKYDNELDFEECNRRNKVYVLSSEEYCFEVY